MAIRAAIVENGIVTNVVVLNDLSEHPFAFHGETANIGDTFDGVTFAPPPPPPKSAAEIQQELTNAVQAHLDSTARTHGYDGILSLASYATSTHPPFAAEGRAGLDWRDAVWGYCYGVMAQVQLGTRPIPTAEELIAELPVMVWPA